MRKKFSIVIPVYGNEKNLPITIPYIMEHLHLFPAYETEMILVCDGSPDDSWRIMEEFRKQYPEIIRTVKFTRNFGQGAAVRCGLEMATGDVLGVISCDLQDPFELFMDMLAEWEKGYKLVIACRKQREDRGFSVFGSRIFHGIVHRLVEPRYPAGGFDFYLMDREVAEAFCRSDIPNASTQMLLLWLGYEDKKLSYERRERAIGKSRWNMGRKVNAALGLMVSYSVFPLRSLGVLGLLLLATGIAGCVIGLFRACVSGCISLLALVLSSEALFTGILLIAIWIIGEYLWRIFDLVKKRPRYVVEKRGD